MKRVSRCAKYPTIVKTLRILRILSIFLILMVCMVCKVCIELRPCTPLNNPDLFHDKDTVGDAPSLNHRNLLIKIKRHLLLAFQLPKQRIRIPIVFTQRIHLKFTQIWIFFNFELNFLRKINQFVVAHQIIKLLT